MRIAGQALSDSKERKEDYLREIMSLIDLALDDLITDPIWSAAPPAFPNAVPGPPPPPPPPRQ